MKDNLMPRILPNTTPDTKSQELLVGVRNMLGSTPNMFTTLANSAASLDFFVKAMGALGGSRLSGALREQIATAVAGANGCDYCASAHEFLGGMHGVDKSELERNLHGKASDPKVAAALNFAVNIVTKHGRVSDTDLRAIRAAGYSEGEVVDIVTVTCLNIFTNYFNHVADTEIDFPKVSTAEVKKAA